MGSSDNGRERKEGGMKDTYRGMAIQLRLVEFVGRWI